jgi:hypothetical protein
LITLHPAAAGSDGGAAPPHQHQKITIYLSLFSEQGQIRRVAEQRAPTTVLPNGAPTAQAGIATLMAIEAQSCRFVSILLLSPIIVAEFLLGECIVGR